MSRRKYDLKFSYEHPDIFYLPQWQTSDKIDGFYVAYRILMAAFYVVVFVILFFAGQHFPLLIRMKAACYYTFWIFFVCAVSAFLSLISVGRQFWRQTKNKEDDTSPNFYKAQWIVHSITVDSAIAVSVGYFSLEFFYQLKPFGAGTSTMHLWNTLLVLMDFFVCSIPARLVQIYPSFILGCLYAIFTYVYYVSGGLGIYDHHYLYKILDYKHEPLLACLALTGILLYMALGRLLLYYADKLKLKVYLKYYYCNGKVEVTRHVPLTQ